MIQPRHPEPKNSVENHQDSVENCRKMLVNAKMVEDPSPALNNQWWLHNLPEPYNHLHQVENHLHQVENHQHPVENDQDPVENYQHPVEDLQNSLEDHQNSVEDLQDSLEYHQDLVQYHRDFVENCRKIQLINPVPVITFSGKEFHSVDEFRRYIGDVRVACCMGDLYETYEPKPFGEWKPEGIRNNLVKLD